MTILQSIAQHPAPFAAGLVLLLVGVYLLRKAAFLALMFLAAALAAATTRHLIAQGWLPEQLLYQAAVYGAFVIVAMLASRHPVVAADVEFIVVLLLCFVAGAWLAAWLRWPQPLVWFLALGGTLLTPVVTVAVFAAGLLSLSLGLTSPLSTSALFLACIAVLRLQWGRWTRTYWDPQLTRDLQAAGFGRFGVRCSGTPASRVGVVFACRTPRKQRLLIGKLRQLGCNVEVFSELGGWACAQVPARMVRAWRSPLAHLLHLQPDLAYSAKHAVTCPPIATSEGEGVPLEELATRLRRYNGQTLPDDRATGKGVVVALLDTGANAATAALKRALIDRVSFAPDDPDPEDKNNHGTAVAACILAVAPDAKIISVKVLDGDGRGTLLSVLRGLLYVAQNRHRIQLANLSLGAGCGDPDCPLCRAMIALADSGVASCCAAGNSGAQGPGSIECPGASRGSLGVGAVDINGHVAPFSSRGPSKAPDVPKPDVCCVGVNVELPDRMGSVWVASGTSFATPLVAGATAGALELSGSGTSVSALYDLIRRSCIPPASDSRDPDATGAGIVNLAKVAANLGALQVPAAAARTPRGVRFAIRTAALAAAVAVLVTAWWLGLSHVGALPVSAPTDRPLVLVGRVRAESKDPRMLWFDDGTGAAPMEWNGQEGTSPIPGRLVVLRARCAARPGGLVVLQGYSRCQLTLTSGLE